MKAHEVVAAWYNHEDFARMRREANATANRVLSGLEINPETSTIRGLENKTVVGAMRRKRNKLQAMLCVSQEQNIQRAQRICDEEHLSLIYIHNTKHCLKEARKLAVQDARFLERETDEDDKATTQHTVSFPPHSPTVEPNTTDNAVRTKKSTRINRFGIAYILRGRQKGIAIMKTKRK